LTHPSRKPALVSWLGSALIALAGCATSGSQRELVSASDAELYSEPVADHADQAIATAPASASSDASEPDPHDVLDDSGGDESQVPVEAQLTRPHPLDGWSDQQLADAIKRDLASLGSISLGSANAGALINGVQAEKIGAL
jgi:hypothetical protein